LGKSINIVIGGCGSNDGIHDWKTGRITGTFPSKIHIIIARNQPRPSPFDKGPTPFFIHIKIEKSDHGRSQVNSTKIMPKEVRHA